MYSYVGGDPINATDPTGTYSYETSWDAQNDSDGLSLAKKKKPAEHTKNKRPSTQKDHEKGQKRKKNDAKGGEKGDKRRDLPKPKGDPSQPPKTDPRYLRPGPKKSQSVMPDDDTAPDPVGTPPPDISPGDVIVGGVVVVGGGIAAYACAVAEPCGLIVITGVGGAALLNAQ